MRTTCIEKMGLEFDRWQDDSAGLILAYDENGDLIHTVGGFALSVPRQAGKCLDVDTELLTANRGWTTMGDIREGDLVLHPAGKPVEVLDVHPVLTDHECYEVTTVDGRRIVADADHLWTVQDKRLQRERLITTRQMIREGLSRYQNETREVVTDGKAYQTKEYRFALPQQHCVELPDQDLPVDPYILGAWLGNGVSSMPRLSSGCEDVDHWIAEIAEAGFVPRKRWDGNAAWDIGIGCEPGAGRQSRSFGGKLRSLDLFNNKHIPEQYLIGSVDQRLALLQGLLDTDGSIDKRGIIEFCSMTKDLADGVLLLARSLGWRAVIRQGRAKLNGRDYGIRYRVGFTPKLVDGLVPFRLARKVARIKTDDGRRGRFSVGIKSIERVATRPVRCIRVDSPDGLFLAGRDLVVTHNTHLVASVVFGLCVEYPGLLVIWTAHHSTTSDETFEAMQGFAARTRIDPFIAKIYTGSGDEEIRFHNGSRIMFGARERGFGRGIPGVDVLVNDEAQILSQRAMQNMLATMNTSKLGLHLYLGTPPKPEDNSEMWLGIRREALAAETNGVDLEDTVWIEIGAHDGAKPDDASQYPIMNPSFPHRTPLKSILRLLKRLDADGFRREGMGLYDEESTTDFDIARWNTLVNYKAGELDQAALLIAVSPDRRWSTIAVCGEGSEGKSLVLVESIKGTSLVVPRIVELQAEQDIIDVAYFSGSSAKLLKPDLVKEGIEFAELSSNDAAAAYGCLQEAIKHGTVEHVDQPELNYALTHSKGRFLNTGETESFDQRGQHVNTSPAIAAAGALYRFGLMAEPVPYIG